MKQLKRRLKEFNDERDWNKFHSPKNLAMSLIAESAEILELFLWQGCKESYSLNEAERVQLKEEIGDVMLCLVNLAQKFDLDPIKCAMFSLKKNGANYPAHIVRGKSLKYTEYQQPGRLKRTH